MGVYGDIVPGATSGARRAQNDVSPAAHRRLKILDWHRQHGANVSRTGRHFTIARSILQRWLARFAPDNLRSLENRSCAPRRRRQRLWSPELVIAVQQLREQYPRWGKDKLVLLLQAQGVACSTSTVGRILTTLRRRGDLREPVLKRISARKRLAQRPHATMTRPSCRARASKRISARKRLAQRPHATRKPREYLAQAAGDIVELDTLDIRSSSSRLLKQFTAPDVVSRYDVLEVRASATASLAAQALTAMLERFPFPVRAIQVDGGSEFMADFELLCQTKGLRLFVLPPRSPKLNGSVERANRTHTEEFYELYDGPWTVAAVQTALRQWESTYNTVRPHQALGYLTPAQWLAEHPPPPLEVAA